MNYQQIIEKAASNLDLLLKGDLKDHVQLVFLKKNDYLLRPGEICRSYFFLQKGIMRSYYLKDGVEITSSFTFPNDVATIYRSIVLEEPSKEYLQAITDCAVYQMRVNDFDHLKEQYPVLSELEKCFTQAYTLLLEERMFSIQFQTARERYKHLLDNYPGLIQSIPLKYIASYLGITIETLSRVRAKTS